MESSSTYDICKLTTGVCKMEERSFINEEINSTLKAQVQQLRTKRWNNFEVKTYRNEAAGIMGRLWGLKISSGNCSFIGKA